MSRLQIITCDGCGAAWRGPVDTEPPANWETVVFRGRTWDIDQPTCLGRLGLRLGDPIIGVEPTLGPIPGRVPRARRARRAPTPATVGDFTP